MIVSAGVKGDIVDSLLFCVCLFIYMCRLGLAASPDVEQVSVCSEASV